MRNEGEMSDIQSRINGRPKTHRSDLVTQEEMRRLAELEVIAWKTIKQVISSVAKIGERVKNGAEVEEGEFVYSEEVGAILGRGQNTTITVLSNDVAESAVPPRRKRS